jgi:hypothetical protein
VSLAKIVKQALSNHDLLPWNKEHNALVFALVLLIIFYQYPFIYSSYYPKEEKKNYTKYLQIHCEKYKEKKIIFK